MKAYIPNQHGAWAMLIVPYIFGLMTVQPTWKHALLFAVWLFAYLFVFYALQALKMRKLERVKAPFRLYGLLFAGSGIAMLLAEPELWKIAWWFLPMLAVNSHFAFHRQERALANDVAAVIQFGVVIFVAERIGSEGGLALAQTFFILHIAYFIGTIFYVKTMIREKNNKSFYYLSIVYHIICPMLLFVVPYLLELPFLPPLLAIPFVLVLIRAIVFPRLKLSVRQAGIAEIVLVALFTLMTFFVY